MVLRVPHKILKRVLILWKGSKIIKRNNLFKKILNKVQQLKSNKNKFKHKYYQQLKNSRMAMKNK
jgi:hypothetical protein